MPVASKSQNSHLTGGLLENSPLMFKELPSNANVLRVRSGQVLIRSRPTNLMKIEEVFIFHYKRATGGQKSVLERKMASDVKKFFLDFNSPMLG